MKTLIKDLPDIERPRERFMEVGPSNLSNLELISIILKTGTKDTSVKDISNKILEEVTKINDLQSFSVNKLTKIKGIGKVKAITLLASLELGKRVYLETVEKNKLKVRNANVVYEYYKDKLSHQKQEYFCVMFLDTKKYLIEEKVLFIGTLDHSTIHPREIFKEALKYSASALICVHNHPSGDATPSYKDVEVTTRLKEIGVLIGINVIDHIIIGNNNYYSFYE